MIKIQKKAETKGQCSIDPLAILILGGIVKTSIDCGKKYFCHFCHLKRVFFNFEASIWLVSLWYHHSCVSGEILTYFDPQYSL